MINLSNIKVGMTRSFGRGGLLLQKHSPEILLGVGLLGMVTSAVLAAKATLKATDVVAETKQTISIINTAGEEGETLGGQTYSKEDHDRDMAVAYVQTGLKFMKLYAPSVGIGVLSITAILAAHGIMHKRQVAIIAAYNLLAEGFQSYRARVVEELGEETDRAYRLGLHEESRTETVLDEEGKKVKVKTHAQVYDPRFKSDYARFFDEASMQWRNDPTLNLYFLKAQQNYSNDLLKSRGHLFLNEVYDMIGLPRSKAGSVVGWVMEQGGDNYVDFDIYNIDNTPGRDFVNGYNRAILLDFNVDGVIYDLI